MKKSKGFILGKFMPPHLGHKYLIDFGSSYCDELTVLVCSLDREPIPGHLRFQWVKDSFPGARVLHYSKDIPQEPSEHPEFWRIWREMISEFAGSNWDYVFASEDYGWRLSSELKATYIPVNHARSLVPISATEIRKEPCKYWEYIIPAARPYFLKKIAIVGPESAGKSTLARQLANHFQTVYVEEYARGLLDFNNGQCEKHHIPLIAKGHLSSEKALSLQANRLLFSDTDVMTTMIWSDVLFGDCPDWIRIAAKEQKIDFHLLLDCDLPWENDGQRYMPELKPRQEFFQRVKGELDRLNRPYELIQGFGEERLARSIQAVNKRFL